MRIGMLVLVMLAGCSATTTPTATDGGTPPSLDAETDASLHCNPCPAWCPAEACSVDPRDCAWVCTVDAGRTP